MRTALKIGATELRTLFYSPIAWFLLVVFLVQCALAYLNKLNEPVVTQEIGGLSLQYLDNLTTRIFWWYPGLLPTVTRYLYLYIPLLTMSLISRETGSGTIKLLF